MEQSSVPTESEPSQPDHDLMWGSQSSSEDCTSSGQCALEQWCVISDSDHQSDQDSVCRSLLDGDQSESVASSSGVLASHASQVALPTSATDIGILLQSGNLHTLPQRSKLELINHSPGHNFIYPTKYLHGCNRRFKPEWVINHPWLHYSIAEDGVYCKACALFAPSDISRQKLGSLVSKPFNLWTKQSSVFLSHEQHQYHQDSMTRMVAFRDSCSAPTGNVACMLDKEREEQILRNSLVIKSLLKCVCFCAKQGISFRGHRDDSTASAEYCNKGNFIELVEFRAETDEVLQMHLKTAPRNALYTSKTIQNEMISVISKTIENIIIMEIKDAKYFTLLADEVTDCANLEQVSLVLRFVDSEKQIREEFLAFITVEQITGAALSAALLSWLKSHNIDIANCRGQGYDGASSMSSNNVGVQARIREVSPLALYTHCQSHRLNLCIVKACSTPYQKYQWSCL